MLVLHLLLPFITFWSALAFSDDRCCCGCPDPCPITLRSLCGAPPTTPCTNRDAFNQSELLSPCDLILRLHELTDGVLDRDAMHQEFMPIVKDTNTRFVNVGQVMHSSQSSFGKAAEENVGKIIKNVTKNEDGTVTREVVREIPGGTQTTFVTYGNGSDPKTQAKIREMMGKIKNGMFVMGDGMREMQHHMIDGVDNVFKGIMDGVESMMDDKKKKK